MATPKAGRLAPVETPEPAPALADIVAHDPPNGPTEKKLKLSRRFPLLKDKLTSLKIAHETPGHDPLRSFARGRRECRRWAGLIKAPASWRLPEKRCGKSRIAGGKLGVAQVEGPREPIGGALVFPQV